MVPYSRNKLFIGQEENRGKLDQALGPDDGHRRLAVWGLGGIGKTQAVLDYVYQFQHRKPVFWIHVGTRVKFEQDYRKIAQQVLLPGHDDSNVDIQPLVRDWLESAESGNWILVLDNADNLIDFFPESTVNDGMDKGLADLIPHGSRGTILVTTRDEVVVLRLCDNQVLHKEAMDQDDAISLFRSPCPRITESHARPLNDLLKELSYLPLAIAQAASYIRENRFVTLTKYLERFQSTKKERLRLLSKDFTDLRRNQDHSNLATVLTTFIISFQQIEEQSPLAGSLLRVMACINRQGMPVELFESVKKPDSTETVEEALSRTISFSLLILSQESAVEMHAFIHLSAQQYLSARHELREAANVTAAVLARVLPEDIHGKRTVWREYLPHASALFDIFEELRLHPGDSGSANCHTSDGSRDVAVGNHLSKGNRVMVSEDFDLVCFRLGTYYLYAGQYDNAERTNSLTCQMSKSLYGEEHPDTLACMHNLASTYWNQGRWKEAEELEMRAMETRKRVIGEEHPDILTSMSNLASTYSHQGRWKEAEELEIRVMETSLRVLGEEHPYTLISMNNLAHTLANQQRLPEAISLMERTVELYLSILGEIHPNTVSSKKRLDEWKSQYRP